MASTSAQVQAEQIATASIYQLRMALVGATPELKLLASKALLRKVREMVSDLEESVPQNKG